MAASHTTNLNLNKPARTDGVSVVSDLNDNMDIIDQEYGKITNYIEQNGQLKRFSSVDVNTIVDSGRYYLNSSCTNKPITGSGYLDVYKYSNNYVHQTFKSEANEFVYERQLDNGTWGLWSSLNSKLTLADNTNITSDYGTFTYKNTATFGNLTIIKIVINVGSSNVPIGSKFVKGLPWASTNFAVIEGWDYTSGKSRRFTINASGELETLDEAIPSGNSIRIVSSYVSA